MPSLTIENYVKSIYLIAAAQEEGPVATGQLAAALNVSPGTVTSMLKTLAESSLAHYTPYEGVRLSEAGRQLALRIIRRHRLIELFLVETLKLTWDEVHEEAENMEHAVSDYLIDRIDEFLGRPAVDPHGDPIPRADGSMREDDSRSLREFAAGDPFRLVRVLDQSPEFLRYLTDSGLQPGAEGEVLAVREEAGVMTVRVGESPITLAREAAEKLLAAPM